MSLVHSWGAQYESAGRTEMNDGATNNKEVSERDLLNQLLDILRRHVSERGSSEGAVEVLERLVRERDAAVYCWEQLTGERQVVPGLTPDLLATRNVFAHWHNASRRVLGYKNGAGDKEDFKEVWSEIVAAAETYTRDRLTVQRVLGLEVCASDEVLARVPR